jgi:hypothetical protein
MSTLAPPMELTAALVWLPLPLALVLLLPYISPLSSRWIWIAAG